MHLQGDIITQNVGRCFLLTVYLRDGGLPASRYFARVHEIHEMPLNALILTTALVIVFGCIFLGSSRYAHHSRVKVLLTEILQRFQRDHLGLGGGSRRFICNSASHQLHSRPQNVTSQTFRTARASWVVLQLGLSQLLPNLYAL